MTRSASLTLIRAGLRNRQSPIDLLKFAGATTNDVVQLATSLYGQPISRPLIYKVAGEKNPLRLTDSKSGAVRAAFEQILGVRIWKD